MTMVKKGATNASKANNVAKARSKDVAAAKSSNAKRKSTASIPVGAKPVRYRFTPAERQALLEGQNLAGERLAEQLRAQALNRTSYQGPRAQTLYRLAALGLILFGLVAGYIVRGIWK